VGGTRYYVSCTIQLINGELHHRLIVDLVEGHDEKPVAGQPVRVAIEQAEDHLVRGEGGVGLRGEGHFLSDGGAVGTAEKGADVAADFFIAFVCYVYLMFWYLLSHGKPSNSHAGKHQAHRHHHHATSRGKAVM
jgi:hypothetical protein